MNRILSMLAGLLLLATTVSASEAPAAYSLDPSLTAQSSSRPAPEEESPIRLRSDDTSAALQLVTGGAISPYVGASRGEESEDEGTSHVGSASEIGPSLDDYHLEAGFACPLNNNANLNVGYRFAESLSNMMDEAPPVLQEQADDLRISLDLKLPF